MQAMFEAEVTAMAGARGKHDSARTAVRHGTEGVGDSGGRRVPVTRPRARTVDGYEVLLQSSRTSPPVTCWRKGCGSGCSPVSRPPARPDRWPVCKDVLDSAGSTGRSAVAAVREADRDRAGRAARAAGMLNAERSFRRIKGYKQMPQLVVASHRHAHPDTTAETHETVALRSDPSAARCRDSNEACAHSTAVPTVISSTRTAIAHAALSAIQPPPR